MARATKTNRFIFDDDAISNTVRSWMTVNSEEALIDYRAQPLEKDAADYPFDDREEDGDIRDPGASKVTPTPLGVKITVEARGALFVEEGNNAEGSRIEANDDNGLHIPLRPGYQLQDPNPKVVSYGGRTYLVRFSVAAYEGKHLLMNAVRKMFKIGV